MKINKLIKKN